MQHTSVSSLQQFLLGTMPQHNFSSVKTELATIRKATVGNNILKQGYTQEGADYSPLKAVVSQVNCRWLTSFA